MPCTITINSAVVSGGNVIVSGTFTSTPPCTAPCVLTINVKVACTDPFGAPISCSGIGNIIGGTTFWQASVPCNCACGTNNVTITATATCTGVPPSCNFTCTATPLVLTTLCCCPSATTTFTLGSCTGNTQLVSFNGIVSIPDACTFCFRRAYGDGNFGGTYCFTGPGTFNYPFEQHNYVAPNSYTSTLDIIPPPFGCPSPVSSNNVTVSCGGCYSSALIAGICLFLEWLFLFSMVVGLALLITVPCTTPLTGLIFLGIAALALIAFYLPFLQCQKCVCDPIPKFLGQIFISLGFVLFMFIIPPTSGTPCSPVTGIVAFFSGIIFLAIGFLTLSTWYNNNKLTCPLIICDFWCAVSGILNIRSATNIALIAILTVWLTILVQSSFLIDYSVGAIVAAIVISVFALFIWNFGPLSVPPCMHNQNCK